MLKVSARLFPIGYIISVDAPNFNPNDFYLDGNWERIRGRVIVGVDGTQTEFNATGKTGGAKTHTLTVAQMPSHSHGMGAVRQYANGNGNSPWITDGAAKYGNENRNTSSAGSGVPHNNLQPYQTAYMWKLISYSN